jgi:hypothetical protein
MHSSSPPFVLHALPISSSLTLSKENTYFKSNKIHREIWHSGKASELYLGLLTSNIGPDTCCPDWRFSWFSSVRNNTPLSRQWFLPYHFHLIAHTAFYYSALYNVSIDNVLMYPTVCSVNIATCKPIVGERLSEQARNNRTGVARSVFYVVHIYPLLGNGYVFSAVARPKPM